MARQTKNPFNLGEMLLEELLQPKELRRHPLQRTNWNNPVAEAA
jgi:hypothetical protein